MTQLKDFSNTEPLFPIKKRGQGWYGGKEVNLIEVDTIVAPLLYDMGFDLELKHKKDNMFQAYPIGRKLLAIDMMIYRVKNIGLVQSKIRHSIPSNVCTKTQADISRISYMLENNLKDCYILIIIRSDSFLLIKDTHFPPEDWFLSTRRVFGDRMQLKGECLIDAFVQTDISTLKKELNVIFKTMKR
jgi:hypothetical protein